MKNLVSLNDLSKNEISGIISLGFKVKKNPDDFSGSLKQKTLAMLFQKTSTRTRISFEAGMTQLGGHAIFLDCKNVQFALGAGIKDEIKCISRYCDLIMARVYKNEDIEAMASASDVPVINGLSDKWHPCQALADFMAMKEKVKSFGKIKLAYVGDGNNVCNSLIQAAAKLGVRISVATPEGYGPFKLAVEEGTKAKVLELTNSPYEAVKGANFVYTDSWVSMGQEAEKEKRIGIFAPFQVNKKLMEESQDAFFMHCLPVHRGLEATDEVVDSGKSIIYDQAENRVHIQKAVILKLLGEA